MEDKQLNRQFNSPVIDNTNRNSIDKYQKIQDQIQQEVDSVKESRENPQLNQKDRFEDTVIKKEEKKNIIFRMLDKLFPQKTKEKIEDKPQESSEATSRETGDFNGLTLRDIVAPIDLEVDFNHLQMGDYYFKTFFISSYPRFVGPNWLSPIINFEHSLRISTFYYPVDSKVILEKLKKKIGEMEATLYSQMEDRKVIDASLKVKLADAQQLQDSIAEGSEKFFHFAMYITIYAPNKELLEKYSRNVTSTLAAMNVTAKQATLLQEAGFISTQPLGLDKMRITRNMDTTSLATTFPFVTSELTMDHGIMYGLNLHNNSLVVFDRFDLENANSVVFATSGAGKSYFVKLEAIRSLMMGTEIIVVDPEREYEELCKSVDGLYVSFSQDQGQKMNPFELSGIQDEGDDELRMKMLSLLGFFKVMFGGLTNVESSILDRALILTYREKGITYDPRTQSNTPPMLEDLYKVLKGMAENEAHNLARRMEKYIVGSGAGIFNEASNFEINNPFTVFSVRDLQEELKPLAMYLMLDFIWTRIRKDQKRRLLIVDEAWYMMQSEDSAKFMYSIAKRARKYYLGLTTITQDVADFMNNDMGKVIISNSSIQMLMKQSPSAIDKLQEVFNLSDGERNFLLNCDRGQGLFFAGSNHVGIQVLASQAEHEVITSDPKDLEEKRRKQQMGIKDSRSIEELAQVFEPPTLQRPAVQANSASKQLSMIQKATQKREEEKLQIEEERKKYEEEVRKKLEEQERTLNPDKYKHTRTFQDDIDENTIPGQVVKNRRDIQKDSQHITPQGIVNFSEDEYYGQQPSNR
ncbi:MAG: ATP-binding protein [Candidatus Dojkabacteria bacterium]|nr:ATP-binding protein [Candidatus Dojkabacteria bacterium]